ncbi:MAG: hypothetical protein QME92_04490 [Bacillota bacterium]|nr:hypothetical protein [Bacillota bacterium]
MFTSMALNQDNIVKVGPGPPPPTKVPVEADVIVGRAGMDVFTQALIPRVTSGAQVMWARLTRDGAQVRCELASADGGSGTRALVTGTLEFAVTFTRDDGLVGFTLVRLPLSTFVDLPGLRFRKDMQAEMGVSVTATATLDAPPGTALGAVVRLDVVVTRTETIALTGFPSNSMSP